MSGESSSWELLILTRVAVRFNETDPAASREWLSSRLDLFRSYCAPSVNGQETPPSLWLLFFDQTTPDDFVQDIMSCIKVPAGAIRLNGPWNQDEVTHSALARAGGSRLITTRLDSDDAIARDYVSQVLKIAAGQVAPPFFVNFMDGAQITPSGVSLYRHPSNAFLSLVDNVDDATFRTVFAVDHDKANRVAAVEQVRSSHPMWLQNVHGGNILNGEGGWRCQPSAVLPHFAVGVSYPELGAVSLFLGRAGSIARFVQRIASRPSRVRWIFRYLTARVAPRRRFRGRQY